MTAHIDLKQDQPNDPNWHSPVEPALVVSDPSNMDWEGSADAIVVGVGGGGICACLEMAERGLSVLAVDRFDDGGATGMSGGVYYGGGTRHQAEAGFPDSAEQMFNYLKHETRGVVSPSTLKRFCDDSADNLEWLEQHGARFAGTCWEPKISYPPAGYYLYYSGNERVAEYARIAQPAPRGHRNVGSGFTGNILWSALRQSMEGMKAVRYLPQSTVRRLVVDQNGRVIGVEILSLPSNIARRHGKIMRGFNRTPFRLTGGPVAVVISRWLQSMETRHGSRKLYRAQKGVVLATGGYVYNRPLAAHFAPEQAGALPLGTISCDGSGIRLAQTAGARLREIGNFDVSRHISPPAPYVFGMAVNGQGDRFVAEDGYSATIGYKITYEQGGVAWIIIDRSLRRKAFRALTWPRHTLDLLWQARTLSGLVLGTRRGRDLASLAERCGLPIARLHKTFDDYNHHAQSLADPLGKAPEHLRPLGPGPYYAVNIGSKCRLNPTSAFSLGGLDVDEDTGQVISSSGNHVPGLYAAGRVAYGVASRQYVSGLSIADCVFSGRRAGRSIAGCS